jgi:hypothetical protein
MSTAAPNAKTAASSRTVLKLADMLRQITLALWKSKCGSQPKRRGRTVHPEHRARKVDLVDRACAFSFAGRPTLNYKLDCQ